MTGLKDRPVRLNKVIMEVVKSIKLGQYKNLDIEIPEGESEGNAVELINRVMRPILDNVEIRYNDDAVEADGDRMFKELEREVTEKEIGMELLCNHYGISDPQKIREALENEVRTSWLEIAALREIALVENIELSDKEYEEARMAHMERNGLKDIAEEDEPDFRNSVLFTKVVRFLVDENVKS